jgi:membrane protease YdiL (CAAX protease family)
MKFFRAMSIVIAVDLVAVFAPRWIGGPKDGFVPGSFVTHSLMLGLSLLIVWVFHRGRFADFGFTRGTYRFDPKILLWALPTAVLSLVSALAAPSGKPEAMLPGFSKLQLVLFVWIYASVCEEVLTRGLLQTLLTKCLGAGSGARRLSTPVVVTAFFFGAMHVVLIPSMGPAAAVPIVLATLLGLLAGKYRESSGSLIPAVIVHALFNVGGMLPGWIVGWVRG